MTQPDTPPAGPNNPGPFDELDSLLAAKRQTERIRQARAMCKLDRLTHPDELLRTEQLDDAAAVSATIVHLQQRIHDRARWCLARHAFEPSTKDDEAQRTNIEVAERLFREAMLAAFEPYPGQLLDLHFFEATFAAWACGDLAIDKLGIRGTQHDLSLLGVPDGANFFCFAESALTFVHMGLSPMFWRPTLRTFVCGAALFAAHHWQRGSRTWRRYSSKPRLAMSSTTFQAMRDQRYAAMDLRTLAEDFGQTVALAMRDEPPVRTFPNPASPEFPNN